MEAQDHDPKDKDMELQGRGIGLVHGPAGFATKNERNEEGQGATQRYRPADFVVQDTGSVGCTMRR